MEATAEKLGKQPVRASLRPVAALEMRNGQPVEDQRVGRFVLALFSVGATGFEPATSCSRSRRSTGLSYAPCGTVVHLLQPNAPGRTRTSNLLIRSQMLYPIELQAQRTAHQRSRTSLRHQQAKDQQPSGSCRRSLLPRDRLPKPQGPTPTVGRTRLELVTSTMSTWRSNQLS